MGILQATSTQTDYTVTLWLTSFAYYSLCVVEKHQLPDWRILYKVGAALGLALLTKSTAYIYAIPFIVWLVLHCLRIDKLKGLIPLVLIMAIAVSINSGFYCRNIQTFNAPLGPASDIKMGEGSGYTNSRFSIATTLSNLIRNASLHWGTPSDKVNRQVEWWLGRLHDVMGVDIDDSRTTWPGTHFEIKLPSNYEDEAGNPLHLLLIILSLGFYWRFPIKIQAITFYMACLCIAFVIFCAYLRWQPWHSRLHLPLFVLWSPIISVVVSRTFGTFLCATLAWVLFISAYPSLMHSVTHPILDEPNIFSTSRKVLYFRSRSELYQDYAKAIHELQKRDCFTVGLLLEENDWEYPFWVILDPSFSGQYRIEHVIVDNISARYYAQPEFSRFVPCAIVRWAGSSFGSIPENYKLGWESKYLSIYSKS
jgi:hypothetical protein